MGLLSVARFLEIQVKKLSTYLMKQFLYLICVEYGECDVRVTIIDNPNILYAIILDVNMVFSYIDSLFMILGPKNVLVMDEISSIGSCYC